MEKHKFYFTKMILGFLTFFLSSRLVVFLLRDLVGIKLVNTNNFHLILVDTVSSILTCIILALVYFKLLKKDLKEFKTKYQNILKFFGKVFIAFLIFFLIKIFVSVFETMLADIFNIELEVSNNQSLIEKLMHGKGSVMLIISCCLLAPFEEEVLFRGGIKQIIKNKKVFVTVSGLIFGLMHVVNSLTLFVEILIVGIILSKISSMNVSKVKKFTLSVLALSVIMLIFTGIYYFQYGNIINLIRGLNKSEILSSITYICMGGVLAYYYQKEDNIYYTIGIHAVNNAFGVLLMLL